MNRQYLEGVRSNSCYPTFRAFVQMFTLLGYLVATLFVVTGFLTGQARVIVFAVAGAIITVLLTHVTKELSLMLADIADATIDTAARAVPASSTANPTVQAVAATSAAVEDDASAMQRYGITLVGDQYHFQDHRYDKLSDAINYAKRQVSQS